MSTPPRLLALDVDGTLADSSGVVRPRTREAVSAAREQGIVVVVATGRPWLVAERTVIEIGDAHWALCSNGAMTLKLGDHQPETVRNLFLPHGFVPGVVHELRKTLPGVAFALEFEMGAKSEPGWKERLPPGVPLGRYVDDVLSLLPARGPVRKLVVFHEHYDQRLDELQSIVGSVLSEGVSAAVAGLPFVEVGLSGVNKAVALSEICEHLAIPARDVVAFGDEANDAEMLAWAGRGVAMGNATPVALQAADEVAPSNDDDGVAVLIEAMLQN